MGTVHKIHKVRKDQDRVDRPAMDPGLRDLPVRADRVATAPHRSVRVSTAAGTANKVSRARKALGAMGHRVLAVRAVLAGTGRRVRVVLVGMGRRVRVDRVDPGTTGSRIRRRRRAVGPRRW